MIYYRTPSTTPATPPWLVGFDPLPGTQVVHRDSVDGHVVGVGDPLVFDPPVRGWADVGEGWEAATGASVIVADLFRQPKWCKTREVDDLTGRTWRAPVIFNEAGGRDFLVRYGGADYLPILTDAQDRCMRVAVAAREAHNAGELTVEKMLRWASVLLAAVNAIPEAAIAALGLNDDALATGVIFAAGIPILPEGTA